MSLLKKLAGETALYGLSSIVGRVLNMLLVPLYTRTLPEAEYGIVHQFYSYSGFLMVLFLYRMETAFFRFGTPIADRERAYTTGLLSLSVSTSIWTLLLLLFAQPLAALLGHAAHPEYVRYFALILACDCLCEMVFARLRLEQRPRRFVAVKLTGIGVNIVFNVFWLLFCPWAAQNGQTWVHAVWKPEFGVGYIFLSNLLSSLAPLLLLSPYLLPVFKTTPNAPASLDVQVPETKKNRFDPALWRGMMRYAGPLVVVSFAGIVNEMLDRALLPWLLPGTETENMAQLGVYGANYKLAMLISLFTQAYRYAAEPFFFKNAQNENALQTQADATKWFTIAASGGMLAILLFLEIVQFFIGEKYRSALHVVPILLAANVLLGVYYNFSTWYRLKDRTAVGAWIAIAGAGLTIGLLFWWVPVFGYVGAAWATLVCYAFMVATTWWTGRVHYPVPYPLGRMAFYFGLAPLLYAASEWIEKTLQLGVVSGFLMDCAVFGVFVGFVFVLEIRRRKS